MALQSERALTFHLPSNPAQPIQVDGTDNESWTYLRGDIPDSARAEAVHERLLALHQNALGEEEQALEEIGNQLGSWLLDTRARDRIVELADRWTPGSNPARIELLIPPNRVDWLWESLRCEGIAEPLAVHPGLTLVRMSSQEGPAQPATVSRLRLEIVAPKLTGSRRWPQLDNLHAAELVGPILREANGSAGRFDIRFNPRGNWERFWQHSKQEGPPDIFYFAGHSRRDGDGIVCRRSDGEPTQVRATKLAAALTRRNNQNRMPQLAILHACWANNPDDREETHGPFHAAQLQPFAALAGHLLKSRLPAVLGIPVPPRDAEAHLLLRTFAASLANGDSVDCALQKGRHALYGRESLTCWAFLILGVLGKPQPLFAAFAGRPSTEPALSSKTLLEVGNQRQLQEIRHYFSSRDPLVFVLHGERHSHHRHLVDQIRLELTRYPRTLWKPIATMCWSVDAEPLVTRQQLLGSLARAFEIPEPQADTELIRLLGEELRSRCASGEVTILDIEELVEIHGDEQAHALVYLVRELWIEILEAATRSQVIAGEPLAVFLFLGITYRLPFTWRLWRRQPILRNLADRHLGPDPRIRHQLGHRKALGDRARVEVLPPIAPITIEDLKDFLAKTFLLPEEKALRKARYLLADNNVTTLENLRRFLEERMGHSAP